jgi:CRISPR system Cascade subunit CasE
MGAIGVGKGELTLITTTNSAMPGSSEIILTRVPLAFPSLSARVRDWLDREAVHRAIMTLFDPVLPGDASVRRAASGILYRVEEDSSNPHILIQSRISPASTSDALVKTDCSGLIPRLIPGSAVTFRIEINAVRCQSRSTRRIAIPEQEIPGWLSHTTLARGLSQIEVRDLEVRVLRAGRTPLRVARINGVAVVRDQASMLALIEQGVGRAKAYGCGLLSVIPSA